MITIRSNHIKIRFTFKNNQLITYQNDYDDIKQQYDEQKILITKLENDLTKYINPNNKTNDNEHIENNNNDPLYKILSMDNNKEEKKVKEDSMVTINIDKNEPKHDDYSVMQLPTKSPSPD